MLIANVTLWFIYVVGMDIMSSRSVCCLIDDLLCQAKDLGILGGQSTRSNKSATKQHAETTGHDMISIPTM